jgi:hypothetical protein
MFFTLYWNGSLLVSYWKGSLLVSLSQVPKNVE